MPILTTAKAPEDLIEQNSAPKLSWNGWRKLEKFGAVLQQATNGQILSYSSDVRVIWAK